MAVTSCYQVAGLLGVHVAVALLTVRDAQQLSIWILGAPSCVRRRRWPSSRAPATPTWCGALGAASARRR